MYSLIMQHVLHRKSNQLHRLADRARGTYADVFRPCVVAGTCKSRRFNCTCIAGATASNLHAERSDFNTSSSVFCTATRARSRFATRFIFLPRADCENFISFPGTRGKRGAWRIFVTYPGFKDLRTVPPMKKSYGARSVFRDYKSQIY